MMRRASGEVVEALPKKQTQDSRIVSTPPPPVQHFEEVCPSTASENTVTIENKNIHFEVAYPHDTKLMSVGLRAMSVDISEDSVSILMQDTIQLKLPKLTPLHLTVEGAPYKVCWAGGSHNFGKFKHISFVIVE
jgi:hypothetical protein